MKPNRSILPQSDPGITHSVMIGVEDADAHCERARTLIHASDR